MVALRGDHEQLARSVTELRKRVHDLESGSTTVKALAETIQQMPQQMQTLAREAAQQALAANANDRRSLIGLRAQIVSVLVGAAGLGVMIESAVVRGHL